ncbi:MAG: 16S rRNA (guanine(966)-N(2))-methyltransferase RsmD [Alphaproteobacteria bacterium]|nr:16S rRNA (guanine(966)-N(2))-methyltransferase RsmD [Alphaproteobacteria bacterium]
MRIVAGKHRGRRLAAPEGASVRPTSDRARESLFNVLAHRPLRTDGQPVLTDARVLDVFAGTGAMGLEALSRGAAHATFVERDRATLAVLEKNVATVGEQARTTILRADALSPPPAKTPANLAFLDPPYGENLAAPALAALAKGGWLEAGAIIVVEIGKKESLAAPPAFSLLDERQYGAARLILLRYDET